jgi:branched-chain amino acid transport system substrate-binding protein
MNPQRNSLLTRGFTEWLLCAFAALLLLLALSAERVSAREIVIAQSLDLSGQSNLGKDFSNGIRTYFDAVNARGGVRGRKINFLQLDDSGEPVQTIENLKRLSKDNEIDALIAPTTARSYLAAAAEIELSNKGLVLFGAPTGARLAAASPRELPIRASYADESRQLMSHIATMQIRTIALVVGDGEESEFAALAFREEAKRRNVALAFDGNNQRWSARTAANAPIEAVVITGDALGVVSALAHARSTARSANIFGFSTVDHRTLLEIGKQNAIGMVLSQAMPSADKNVFSFQREHRELMKKYRDEPPSLHTLEGYVVARVLVAALESISGEVTALRVSSALRTVRDIDLGPMSVSTRIPTSAVRFTNLSVVSRKGSLID